MGLYGRHNFKTFVWFVQIYEVLYRRCRFMRLCTGAKDLYIGPHIEGIDL